MRFRPSNFASNHQLLKQSLRASAAFEMQQTPSSSVKANSLVTEGALGVDSKSLPLAGLRGEGDWALWHCMRAGRGAQISREKTCTKGESCCLGEGKG